MRKTGLVLAGAGVLIAAGGVYGWGAGAFYPCGPLDRLVNVSNCTIIMRFDGAITETLIASADGTLATILRGAGERPGSPQRLVRLGDDGAILSEQPLANIDPAASVMVAAQSADGSRLAVTVLDEPVTVFDTATGASLLSLPVISAAHVGFRADGAILLDRGVATVERPVSGEAQTFAAADGTEIGVTTGLEAAPIFTRGISVAMSADGTLLAQHVETDNSSGVVAVRIADAASADWSGRVLVAPLDAWRLGRQLLPELSFSPDGRYLAASFDAPKDWSDVSSALIVWSLESDEVVARIPTTMEWRSIAWLPGNRIAVSRYNPGSLRSDVAVIVLD